jgi:hypothetical protein
MRSMVEGQDCLPLRVLWPVHLGLMSRNHGSVHGFLSRWIKDPWLSRAAFLSESLVFLIFTCQSFHLLRFLQTSPKFCKLAPVYSV